jgi:hypothetical protein
VHKHRDRMKAIGSHLGTGQIEVYEAVLWALGLALRELVRTRDTLHTQGVTKVDIFPDSQGAIL